MSQTQTIYGWLSQTPANKFFDTYVRGALDVSGYMHLRHGTLVLSDGDASFNGNMVVQQDATIKNDLTVLNDSEITGTLKLHGDASLNSTLSVANDVSLNSKLYVNGVTTVNSDVVPANNNVSLGTESNPFKSVFVSGNSLHLGTSANGEDVTVLSLDNSGLLITTNDVSFDVVTFHRESASTGIGKRSDSTSANLDVSGSFMASGRADVLSDVSFGSTLHVVGATSMDSTLAVTDATTFSSTLAVSGAATMSSTLAVTDATTLSLPLWPCPMPLL